MRGLTRQVTVKVLAQFTAQQWQLYISMGEIADRAARTLSEKLSEFVNAGYSREETYRAMVRIMGEYEAVGATDSEPFRFLDAVLDEIFKE
jgi:DNA phosphorothioation-dependent restriction protein DptG